MSENDLQFQADLERAQALSIESLALEQFERRKKVTDNNADDSVSLRRRTKADGVPPPALPPPPRRPSRVQRTPLADQTVVDCPEVQPANASPQREQQSDLISFTSPKSTNKDPHTSLKEYIEQINKLGQKTEELAIVPRKDSSTPTVMNPYYNPQPGYGYPPYNYSYPPQHPYGAIPPYPPAAQHPNFATPHTNAPTTYPTASNPAASPYTQAAAPYPNPAGTTYSSPAGTPYGMSPIPGYPYYKSTPTPLEPNANHQRPSSSPYPTAIPYTHTRMASPTPYMGYPPQHQSIPQYNYNTTNMISRPSRPLPVSHPTPSIYPQLSQMHHYYPTSSALAGQNQSTNVAFNPRTSAVQNNAKPVASTPDVSVSGEENNSSKAEFSRKLSEASIASNEANDTVGNLPKSTNLIDFTGRNGANTQGSVRVSVLEAFDPLLTETNNAEYVVKSECSSSVYDEFDPLDFLYGETVLREVPVYATVNKRDSAVVPSPPPKSIPTVPAVAKRSTTNKLYDCITKIRTRNYDNEHKAFLEMVLDVRKQCSHSDDKTNPGHVIAARTGGKYPPSTSIKILVHHSHSDEPITFTSDVESTVEHVILTVVCTLEAEIREDMSEYMLRVWGVNEYLTPGSNLSEYDYIRLCVRLEKDVRLCLHEGRDISLARNERDDMRDSHLTLEELLPTQGMSPMLSFDNLSILLETLEGELSRAVGEAGAEGTCAPNAVMQAVKAICALAGGLETLHVTHTLKAFVQACCTQSNSGVVRPEIVGESGQYCAVSLRSATPREAVTLQCSRVRDAVRALVALYTRTRLVDFQLTDTQYLTPSDIGKAVPASTVSETTLFCIEAVHRLPPCWQHDEYLFHAQVYHGTRPLKGARLTPSTTIENSGFYPRIMFDTWLNLEEIPVNTLPREARLVVTLYGRTARTEETPHEEQKDAETKAEDVENGVEFQQEELGWTSLQLFSYEGMLASGNYILPLWPTCADKRLGPAPHPMHSPLLPHAAVNIEVPLYTHTGVKWSSSDNERTDGTEKELPSFDSLDGHTQSQLIHLIEQGAYQRMPTECREILWEKRQYLVQIPGALPLVLLAATNWYGEHRAHLLSLVRQWDMPSPLNAMHLFLPCFPDLCVREVATELAAAMSDDALSCVLPQLVQAVRHEPYERSPLAQLLLTRALHSPAVAHKLYWLLVHSLPGSVPQNSNQEFLGITLEDSLASSEEVESGMVSCWRYQLLLRALLAIAGENLSRTLLKQQLLVKGLSDVANSVKLAKEGGRQRALTSGVEQLASLVQVGTTALPLGLSREVHDIDIKSCSYFSSNTLPLKINFIGTDEAVVPAMFKVGDDLRQDALVLQVMRVMDSLWLKEGLDLRMVTFQAIPTHNRSGMIEIVTEAETLRAIQTEWGLTGSFKDRPIAEWLAKHNPSELEYERARDNFTASCAGYSVATYLLGICDRHNDNIMLKTSGHLFHIDFGKFLGDAQMFGNFKRDRAPFVLTHDMAYVINGGERPTQRFHYFVELCCMAFNIVRAHHNHILDLFALMATSGVPGVTMAAVTYVRSALLPGATQAEAAAAFARLINSSLKSKFTPINFFLHNLAQLRASGDQSSSSSELLSFMPRTYTMAAEGRLVSVEVLSYEKRYDPEKHYVYSLRIYRQGQTTPIVLYRSYKHFTELYQKICLHFPLAKVHSLPIGLHIGRSNTRQVAERRFGDVQAFLTSLFGLADEIAHSDLVYTFFHPLLRDQQDAAPQRLKHKVDNSEPENNGSGSIKISVQYTAGVLSVFILHAQSLALTPQGLPPNPYVKVYLVPDPTKETKRKTRVLKRNAHPCFMEMLEYRLPLDVVTSRSLKATVWHYDSLQENQFLGGVVVPLSSLNLRQETVSWYTLEYITR